MKISLLSLALFFFISFSFGQGYSIIDNKAIKMHQEGDELVQKRMYDEAMEKYRASIEREAGFLESYIKWGRILLTKGKPQEAIVVAERGEARSKQAKNQIKGEFKWLKVHCYLAMGMFEGAIIGGIAVVYAIGIPVMAANLKVDLLTATTYATPFLTGDFIKVALTALIAFGLHRAYPKAFKN